MVGTPKNMVVAPLVAASRTASSANRSNRAGGAGRKRAEEPGHKAVHVEQGEAQDEPVLGAPVPGRHQGGRARHQRPVGVDGTLRLPRGARGVDDQRVIAGYQISVRTRSPDAPCCAWRIGGCRRRGRESVDGQHGRCHLGAEQVVSVGDRDHRPGVTDHVGDLLRGRRGADRHEHRPGVQDSEKDLYGFGRRPGTPHDTVSLGDAAVGERPGHPHGALRQRSSVDHTPGILPVDEHGSSGVRGPVSCPDLGQRRCRSAGRRLRPTTGRDERPHRPGPFVIVWRS